MRIGEILLRLGLLTLEQLDAALAAQVVHGGRLGTNLLDLGYVPLELLTRALAQQSGVPGALPKHFETVTAATVRMLPKPTADRILAVPLGLLPAVGDRKILGVSFADPTDLVAVDEVSFATGMKVRPFVAAEACLRMYLEKCYGIPRPARARAARRHSKLNQAAQNMPGPVPAGTPTPWNGNPVVAGRRHYSGQHRPAPMAATATLADIPQDLVAAAAAPQPMPGNTVHVRSVQMAVISPMAARQAPAPVVPTPIRLPRKRKPTEYDIDVSFDTEDANLLFGRGDGEPEPPRARAIEVTPGRRHAASRQASLKSRTIDRPALSLEDALQALEHCRDREAIGEAVVDYLRSTFGCGLVLFVRDGLLMGWKGFAPGMEASVVEALMLPLNTPSMFAIAHERATLFRGAPPGNGTAVQSRLWKLLGCEPPKEVLVAPITLKTRVISLIYTHAVGGGALPIVAAGEVNTLAEAAAAAFVRVIRDGRN